MAYLQLKDVLRHAEGLRNFVRDYAQRRSRQAKDDYVEGVFKDLAQHEERLHKCLTEFENEADQRLVETWLQFPGVEKLEQAMDDLVAVDGDNDEVILQMVISANETLLEVYDQANAQTEAPAMDELLGHLRELQDQHLREMAKSVNSFQQM